jgi:hypothetical protein
LFEDDCEPDAVGGCAGGGVPSAKTGTVLIALMEITNKTVNSITLKRLFLYNIGSLSFK